MKKRITALVLVLILALGLCPGVSAAPVWSVTDGAVSVSGPADGQYAFAAGYDEAGRFLGAKVLTANGDAQPIPGAAEVKLFWTDGLFAPLSEAVSLPSAYQTVRKIDGQVVLCYEGPGGVTVTTPVTEKITDHFVYYNSRHEGLCIGGKYYSATHLPVEDCDYTVTQTGFERWICQPGIPTRDTLDFYLDPWGNICWIDLVKEYQYPVEVGLLLSAGVVNGSTVQAELVWSGNSASTVEVSILNGRPITDPDAAAAELSAHAPGGFYACQQQRDGSGYSLRPVEGDPSSDWGATLTIPPDAVTAPAADFTGGAVNCVADDKTLFVVSRGLPGEEVVTRYQGYQDLPAVKVLQGTIVTTQASASAATPVAQFVYLRTLDVELPEECVFLYDTQMLPSLDPHGEWVYRVPIVDSSSNTYMPVSEQLVEAIRADSMEIGQFAGNTYVGKFCAITEMNGKTGMVSALEPMETAEVLALENGVIETAAGSWDYDAATWCVYVDLGWEDMDGDGVRSDEDQITLTGCSFFDPDNSFIGLDDVSPDPASGAIYRSIKAAVIAPEGSSTAKYIYLVRELW